jgi:hypothetical protein
MDEKGKEIIRILSRQMFQVTLLTLNCLGKAATPHRRASAVIILATMPLMLIEGKGSTGAPTCSPFFSTSLFPQDHPVP